jgi:POT family proton-dependent oligopeptide transporter
MATTGHSTLDQTTGRLTHDLPPDDLDKIVNDKSFFGHPRGLATLFMMEMWERFSFYGIRPLLILFMTAALASGGFAFDRKTASSIVGIYAACVYLASLPGGWIADRWLGLQRSIFWGGVLIAFGHLSIGLSAFFGGPTFFLGLIFIVLGTGLLKPNISAIVGPLYPEGGARRDAAFAIFYTGINTGALIAPLITGILGERLGWHWGFGAAGVGMLIGLITYRMRAPQTLGSIGLQPSGDASTQAKTRNIVIVLVAALAVFVGLAMSGIVPINAVVIAERMTIAIVTLALIYFAYLFLAGGLDREDKKRVVVILVLFVFSAIFWAAFEQAPTSLNLFARDYTDRVVFGWEMPTTWMQAANSVFVVLLAPVAAVFWTGLANKDKDPSSAAKFSVGLLITGVGFLIMLGAANVVIKGGGAVRVSPWWLVASYFFQTIGELLVSPVGLSSMTKLAPKKFAGQMMGVWFMATSLGEIIAGLVGGHIDPEKLNEMPALFQQTALSLIIAGVACGLLVIPIRRMMGSRT